MKKILVIDDEKATLFMIRLLLGVYGYTVFTAENGEEGIAVFRKERPLIVLTDVRMPGVDGIAVLKEIKKIDPKVEVIVTTGHDDMDLTRQAMDLDATDFVQKPIQTEALEAALKKAEERLMKE